MSSEEILKVLEIYPPIVEVRIPESVCASRYDEIVELIKDKFKGSFPDKTKFIVVNIGHHPKGFLSTPILNNEEGDVQEFIEKWKSTPTFPSAVILDRSELIPYNFVQIHSVLKDGEELFTEKLRIFNELLIKELDKDEPEARDLCML